MKNKRKKIKGRIVIDRELCKGCRYCSMACPKGLITTGRSLNSIGCYPAVFNESGDCTGCALCARMCPDIAIEVWRE